MARRGPISHFKLSGSSGLGLGLGLDGLDLTQIILPAKSLLMFGREFITCNNFDDISIARGQFVITIYYKGKDVHGHFP